MANSCTHAAHAPHTQWSTAAHPAQSAHSFSLLLQPIQPSPPAQSALSSSPLLQPIQPSPPALSSSPSSPILQPSPPALSSSPSSPLLQPIQHIQPSPPVSSSDSSPLLQTPALSSSPLLQTPAVSSSLLLRHQPSPTALSYSPSSRLLQPSPPAHPALSSSPLLQPSPQTYQPALHQPMVRAGSAAAAEEKHSWRGGEERRGGQAACCTECRCLRGEWTTTDWVKAVLVPGETHGAAAGAAAAAGGAGGAERRGEAAMEDGGGYVEFDVPEFSSSVLNQLNELRLQGKLCDIIVHIQGQPFRAHKAVLAASSPYFRDHSALGTMSGLSISVIKNPEVFEQLLAFCYTGRMALRLRDIISFLTAASFLQMQAVIDKCTQILEGLHAKIHLPPGVLASDAMHPGSDEETPPPGEGGPSSSRAGRNGVKDGGLFLNPTQISPPYYPRGRPAGLAPRHPHHQGAAAAQEEAQSDRCSSDGAASEQDASMEGEVEQVELIGRDGQVTDVHVKLEKTERPSQSDSSSTTGDDGYHTELVDGEQVLAVSVGSYGPVITAPPGGYSYAAGLASPCFLSLSSSPSPSRSLLSGFRGGRARSKRALPLPADMLGQLKGGVGAEGGEAGDGAARGGAGAFEGGEAREHGLRGQQWYPYNERLICIYCGKSFNQKGSLDRHMRLHMGITPFVCKFCGKKYTRKDQLEYHIRGHTDNKPFHCQLCGKCFPFQGTLNQHLRKKHMGATPEGPPNHTHSPEPLEGGAGAGEGGGGDPEEASETGAPAFGEGYGEEPPGHDNSEENPGRSPE
ncbi:hypothetical protein ACEWY4_012472 [Coilia grayii]|uniref:Zinc finger and BTB domain containing 34 n=1 Tax=Coilia grayii TaxID=363190 RepID=A0ABD1K0K5_9TELE